MWVIPGSAMAVMHDKYSFDVFLPCNFWTPEEGASMTANARLSGGEREDELVAISHVTSWHLSLSRPRPASLPGLLLWLLHAWGAKKSGAIQLPVLFRFLGCLEYGGGMGWGGMWTWSRCVAYTIWPVAVVKLRPAVAMGSNRIMPPFWTAGLSL